MDEDTTSSWTDVETRVTIFTEKHLRNIRKMTKLSKKYHN